MCEVARFIHEKDALMSRVIKTESGFRVTLADTDAGRELPTSFIFQDQERATKRAEFLLFPEHFSYVQP